MKMGEKKKAIEEYLYTAENYEADNLSQISAAIYKQVLQIAPEQANVYQKLVDIHLKEGFLGDAIATYERLAGYYYNQGKQDEAVKTLEKMIPIDRDSVYTKKKIDNFYSERGIEPKVEQTDGDKWELYDPITAGKKQGEHPSSGENVKFYDLEAALLDDLITEEDADKKLAAVEDDDGAGKLGFDEIFSKLKSYELEEGQQDNSFFHYNLGIAYQQVGRFDEAIEEIEKSLDNPERTTDCCLRLAVCYRGKNQMDEALRYLKKGLHDDDLSEEKKIELKYEQALSYKGKGKNRKARKIFKEVYEINSAFRDVVKELEEVSK
jgi:tetratricopeptide (TPR) repeat protein